MSIDLSERSRLMWQNPEYRKKMAVAQRAARARPDVKEKDRANAALRNRDPAVIAKQVSARAALRWSRERDAGVTGQWITSRNRAAVRRMRLSGMADHEIIRLLNGGPRNDE